MGKSDQGEAKFVNVEFLNVKFKEKCCERLIEC